MSQFNSGIYHGEVRHRRFVPHGHSFSYPLYMLYLDLDELPALDKQVRWFGVNRANLISWWRKDYLRSGGEDLKQAVLAKAADFYRRHDTALPDWQRVCMLTQPRYLGIVFNPITLYYCFDATNQLQTIVADVGNTPWNERHAYVLPMQGSIGDVQSTNHGHQQHFRCQKVFHVSPFNPMQMDYQWRVSTPGKQLFVHIENHLQGEGNEKHFDATMAMQLAPIEQLSRFAWRQPLMTVQVVWSIYLQALKLWLKRTPIYDHP